MNNAGKRVFITGTAGFIGFHLARRLLDDGCTVVGYDAVTPYYDVALKRRRLAVLELRESFSQVEARLEDAAALSRAVASLAPDFIIHLAAQAGVRHGLEHPQDYASTNLGGTLNLLEAARHHPPEHLLIASSSSVYGGAGASASREADAADHPLSLYAATKKAAEAMSHAYSHLFGLATTCFRFFTVYGPWGRPDMALFKFVDAVEWGRAIPLFGGGRMRRDFTYVDDLVEAVVRLMAQKPVVGRPVTAATDSLSPVAPWRTVNIGGGRPVELLAFIDAIARHTGKPIEIEHLPMQPGDVNDTLADPALLAALTGFVPSTSIDQGIGDFVRWYRTTYSTGDARDI